MFFPPICNLYPPDVVEAGWFGVVFLPDHLFWYASTYSVPDDGTYSDKGDYGIMNISSSISSMVGIGIIFIVLILIIRRSIIVVVFVMVVLVV